jgi:hypothetical protein
LLKVNPTRSSTDDHNPTTVKTTIIEETTTTYSKGNTVENDLIIKSEFDRSARKDLDWIDNIERILEEKSGNHIQLRERLEILQVE